MLYTPFILTTLLPLTIWKLNCYSIAGHTSLLAIVWDKEHTIIAFLIALIVLLVLIYSICIEIGKRRTRKREKELLAESDDLQLKIKEKTAENQSKEKQIKELKDELVKTNTKHKEANFSYEERIVLLRQEKIYLFIHEKIGSEYIKSGQDYPKLKLTDTQKVKIFKTIDKVFPGFSTKICNRFPRLTTQDVFYCCLYIMGLNEKQAAALTGKTYQAVWARSAKMNEIFGNNANLKIILRDFLLKEWS